MLFKVIIYSSLLLVTLDIFEINLVKDVFGQRGLVRDPCSTRRQRLLSLLNLLCNDTQNASIVARDACYGCFFRAALLTVGQTLLAQLSQCATIYLNGTSYGICALQLAQLASGLRATSAPTIRNCYTGYCEFVQCLRRINANNLIDACLLASITTLNLTIQSNRIALYTNTTSCILASARCDPYNPITGVFQGIVGQSQTVQLTNAAALQNSLQITPNGDLRVISFPRTVFAAETFCSVSNTLDQSTSGLCNLVG
uniref:CSON006660 protein n=1 Tax=Culicoides sonorensis TaxID=179676 RepID=A0A336MZW9_CULSO